VIELFLRFVQVGISLRGASRVLTLIFEAFGLPFDAPHWTTGRLWLLRFGLARLNANKSKASDWVWMLDHSVQIGPQKVLLIIGIRQQALPQRGQSLRLEDMELIALEAMESSTREDVAVRLMEAAHRTSVPRAIVNDQGSDLTGGVELFRQTYPETLAILDTKHKAACLLKARLERNPRWQSFATRVGQTRCAIQQTEQAPLVPPGPRPKSRFMNLGPQLKWATKVLAVVDHPPTSVLAKTTPARLEEKLGWLRAYREELAEWGQWQTIVDETNAHVARHGLDATTVTVLNQELEKRLPSEQRTAGGRQLVEDLTKFVGDQASKVPKGERLPGSTEVLESCFGKFKALEKHHAKSGFTSLLLGIGALIGKMTTETIESAMRAIPAQDVRDWCEEHLGKTFYGQRRAAFATQASAQQK
jgi:hypothetical protein